MPLLPAAIGSMAHAYDRAQLPYRPPTPVAASVSLLARHPTKTLVTVFRCALHSKLPMAHSPGCACSVTHTTVEKTTAEWTGAERDAYFAFARENPMERGHGYKPRRQEARKKMKPTFLRSGT